MKFLRAATGKIREATYEGQPNIVVNVIACVEGVIAALGSDGPEYVPSRVLAASPDRWNSLPVTNGHPMHNGHPISASSPAVLDAYGIGRIFRARVEGSKLCLDAYISPDKATSIGAHRLLERLRSGDVCEVSIGAHVVVDNTSGVYAGRRYAAVWRSLVPNHLAVLENQKGACDVETGGCGANRSATRVLRAYEPPDSYAASTAALRSAYAQALSVNAIFRNSEISPTTSETSRRECRDPQIRAAHRLLSALESDPPPPLTSIRVAKLANAHGNCDRGSITIDPRSPMYRSAQRGDLLPLAMLLHHEHHHAIHGDDETSAFASSLSFLQRHHGDPSLIADVKTHLSDSFTKG